MHVTSCAVKYVISNDKSNKKSVENILEIFDLIFNLNFDFNHWKMKCYKDLSQTIFYQFR